MTLKNTLKITMMLMVALILLSTSCEKDPEPEKKKEPTPYNFKVPKGFPTNYKIPSDNPWTEEGIKLGRYLYYDVRLSGRAEEGKPQTCASCHIQKFAFENGTGKGIGVTGDSTHHVMLPHINLLWNPGTFGWNGGTPSIEADVLGTITNPNEFASTHAKVVAAISAIDMYPAMFEAAFGTKEINIDRISKAIAQFVRTQVSANSKFDKVLRGEANFTTQEQRGYSLFQNEEGADCFHCHGSLGNPLFTTHKFYNNAKETVFDKDNDRYSVTGKTRDIGAYKATTLRNIELTGPYMHDGRFKTLDQVIDFYSEGLVYSRYAHPLMEKLRPPYGHGAELSPQQKADLKAFLLTLTDNDFIDPTNNLSNPFK